MIKRILIGLGGAPYVGSEVHHAVEIAKRYDAEITGVTVIDTARLADVGPIPVGGGGAAAELQHYRLEEAEKSVQEIVDGFHEACGDVPHRVIREEGEPFETLTSLSRYHDAVVLGLRGWFEYGLVTNPKDQVTKLMHHGVQPIFAVGEEYKPVERVLIAYNGSVESANALRRYTRLRPWGDVTTQVACFDISQNKASPLLRDAVEYLRIHGVEADTSCVDGSNTKGVIEYAGEWNADVIVMGASLRTKIMQFIMGDTVHYMITHADLPLWLSH